MRKWWNEVSWMCALVGIDTDQFMLIRALRWARSLRVGGLS